MPLKPSRPGQWPAPRNVNLILGMVIGVLLVTSGAAAQDDGQTSSFAEAFFISHSVDAEGGRKIEWLGSFVIWILLATSVASLGLIGQLAASNRADRIMPGKLRKQVSSSLEQGRYRETLTMLNDDPSDFARVLHGGELVEQLGIGERIHCDAPGLGFGFGLRLGVGVGLGSGL